jgi:VWFA-related protein
MVCLTAAAALCQTPAPAPATAPAPAPAQTAPPIDKNAPEISTKEAPALFQTRVNLVSVPVVVRDSKGHAIGTYTKENFQVLDKGKPQEIVRFALEKAGDLVAKAAKTVDAIPTEGEPANIDIPERFIAFLFDDIHLPFGDLARARIAAAHQLAKLARTDRAAIFTTSGQNQVDFTDDIDKLQADLLLLRNRSLSSMGGLPQCPDISAYMADRMVNFNDPQAINLAMQEDQMCVGGGPNGAQMSAQAAQSMVLGLAQQVVGTSEQETRINLGVLKDLVRHMSAMPGQRVIIVVSPGFLAIQQTQDKNDILDRAIKANVVINSLDARGLYTDPMFDASQPGRSQTPQFQILKEQFDRDAASVQGDVLAEMAYGTGGSFFHNNNDLDQGFNLAATAPEYYYVLGFSPQNLKLDGNFHSLKVVIKPPPGSGFDIQARKGYYAPKKLSDAEETAKEEMGEALFSRDELSDLPVELHTQFFKASDKDATISVVCRLDPRHIQFRKADGRNINTLKVVTAVFDRNGNVMSVIQKTVEIKMKDETLARLQAIGAMSIKTNFSVTPGSYMVRLVVRESEGQLMSALNGAVAIQ